MKYSQVRRYQMSATTDVSNVAQEEFPKQIADVLLILIDQAQKRYGATVDWTTLSVQPQEPVYIVTMAGGRSRTPALLEVSAEAVEIITGTTQEEQE